MTSHLHLILNAGEKGQLKLYGNINGHPLFNNEVQYEIASQNAVDAINDARGEYFSQQANNASHDQMVMNKISNNIMSVNGNIPLGHINSNLISSNLYFAQDATRNTIKSREKRIFLKTKSNSRSKTFPFDSGDALTIYNNFASNGYKIPYVGNVMSVYGVGDDLVNGRLDQAVWKSVGALGGTYTVGFKLSTIVYNSDYVTTGRGQIYY
ncbi:hypothetical protein L3073_14000 [Ancylomarina sp. DW003]|nr:hypothetical protein [Ancylomarina sp. DW003]MDE5423328.1 hypothetical protein [Ancylomarina sp. DW003]